jgi:exonuclease VII small subunit
MSEISKESASDLIERIVEEALNPYLWRLEDVVQAFEDAADRLIEEQRRLDMTRSEMAREARKANGRDARP